MANDLTKINDLQNSLLESIQTVVNKALFQLDKDVTKICTITNIDKRSTGEYTVKDEVVEYQAYSADSGLALNDRVYVLVPNGNQDNQKLIIGKVLTEKEAPYIYRSPFESIIETSTNLALGTAEMGLIANVEKIPDYPFEEIKITINNTEPVNEILGLRFDIKTLLNTCNTGTYGVRLGITGKIQGNQAYRIVEFTNEEMFGNTYDFSAFTTQEKTFDVGAFESISQIDVLFFQGNDFITKDNEEFSYPSKDEIVPNIFLDNLYICFGKAIPTTGVDYAFISCAEGKHYSRYNIETDGVRVEEKKDANNKTLVLKWLHNFEDGSYRLAKLNNDKTAFEETELADYYFDFYRYDIGSAGDPNGGVFWHKIARDNNKNPQLIFTPDVDLQNELIKVVITKKVNDSYTMILTSDVLTLENDEKVNNRTVAEYLADLVIEPDDETSGQYYIYNEAGQLIDSTQAEKRRWFNFILLKNPITQLADDDYLKIEFPTDKTMLEFYKGAENPEKISENTITITSKDCDNISELKYFYKIKYYNNPSYINNTVKVTLQISKKLYYAEISMGFGIQGTKGTERTLIVELAGNYPYVYHEKENWNNSRYYDLNIWLQDEQGNIIDLNTSTYQSKLSLSWYNKSIINEKKDEEGNVTYPEFLEIVDKDNKKQIKANWNYFTGFSPFKDYPEKYIYILKVEFQGGTYKPLEGDEVTLNALEAYLPIPIRSQYEKIMVSGPTSVYYLSDGSTEFQKASYKIDNDDTGIFEIAIDDKNLLDAKLKWEGAKTETEKKEAKDAYDNALSALQPFVGELDTDNKLKVPTFYLKDSPNYAVLVKNSNDFFGIYPILVLQNKYPSRVINKWDGKTLTIDKDKGLILSTAIAAGRKNSDNTFSGVMLGDWSNTSATSDLTGQTGIYGFHNGEMSYAFKENGTAFIGTSSNGGRIEFDGNKAVIQSQGYATESGKGMRIHLGTSSVLPYIHMTDQNNTEFDVNDLIVGKKALQIGENFKIGWNGDIWSKGGTITAGTLKSSNKPGEENSIKLKGAFNVFNDTDQGSIIGLMGKTQANTGEGSSILSDGIGFAVKLSADDTAYKSKIVAAIGSAGISYDDDYFISLSSSGINIGRVKENPKGKINFTNVDMKAYAVFG